MDVLQKITDIIEPSLDAIGYHVVQIKLSDGVRTKTLMVMAERTDDKSMSFTDCTEISRTISALLEVDDPIQGYYDLEVCSPGLDRPLTKKPDFIKYKGQEAKCETFVPIDGRKRFRGILQGMDGDEILIDMPEGTAKVPFSNIRSAKLMMNDALIAAAMKKQNDEQNKDDEKKKKSYSKSKPGMKPVLKKKKA